jgi:hypothetical protein
MRSTALPRQPPPKRLNDEKASGLSTTNQLTRENWTIPPGQRHPARNLLMEQLARVKLPGNAHSILNAIARTTIYCNRWWKFIDCRYLVAKTGIDPRTIRRTLGDLRRRNVLLYGPRHHQEDSPYRGRDKASAIGINFDFQQWSVPLRKTPEATEESDGDVRLPGQGKSDTDARPKSDKDAQPHYENSQGTGAAASSSSASLDAAASEREPAGRVEPEWVICELCKEASALPRRPAACFYCESLLLVETTALLREVEGLKSEDLAALLREVGVEEHEIEFCLSTDHESVSRATRWLALRLLQLEEAE